jgi:hypothetical protein
MAGMSRYEQVTKLKPNCDSHPRRFESANKESRSVTSDQGAEYGTQGGKDPSSHSGSESGG